MIYEIAGLKVEMEPKFGRLTRQSEAYRSSGEPVMKVKPDQNDEAYVALNRYTEEDREYICCSAMFCRSIIHYGRFFLHASAVVYKGEAYLFSAPSGMGKSTHTALWCKRFPKSYILNDDKPVIMPEKEHITIWGTPFSGKTDLQVNREVPLKAICFLKQGGENRIRQVTEDRAIALMLNNTYRPRSSYGMNLLLDMLEQVVARINIFEMSCTGEPEAAEISYRAMKGK
ncbi:MAG: hypothetical protein Q4D76_11695 [Oscillospiraceae bacterium]|nr:hypothetical protein [Oscillospiraceae bacterium]